MKPIEIKRITSNDVLALQNISSQTFIETFAAVNTSENMTSYLVEEFSLEKLSSELINPNIEYYFARIGEEVIGYLKLNIGIAQKELQNENSLEIERIYVSKEYLGKQVGQLLLGKAIAIANDIKLNFIWLGVWEKNQRAIRFYEKNGFEVFDEHLFILGNDKQTDLLMKLKL
jgi:ribosomal protein S18 acetylase RimI-like enzyme